MHRQNGYQCWLALAPIAKALPLQQNTSAKHFNFLTNWTSSAQIQKQSASQFIKIQIFKKKTWTASRKFKMHMGLCDQRKGYPAILESVIAGKS
ncbi:hypothetical protein [Paraburkholderia youngii]|uniref:hypothetical protein n=1 Tax=Paraburkholderia youngii TaxID=2782701 RepID=UPI003D1BF439